MRTGRIERNTSETAILVEVNLDGTGAYDVATGIGFLDHMIEQFARHSLIDVTMKVSGDLHVDQHHTTEDSAIALGQALAQALGDKGGIGRYGSAYSPMDETLARVALDISGRPYLVWRAGFSQEKLGEWDTELIEHWFHSVAQACGHHAACRAALRHQQPSHLRKHLQGLRPRDARRRWRSTRARAARCRAPRDSSAGRPMAEAIALIDYGAGNLHSVAQRAEGRGARSTFTSPPIPTIVRGARRIVLPGVGSFKACAHGLKAIPGLVEALDERVLHAGVPVPRHLRGHAAARHARHGARGDQGARLDRGRGARDRAHRPGDQGPAHGLERRAPDAAPRWRTTDRTGRSLLPPFVPFRRRRGPRRGGDDRPRRRAGGCGGARQHPGRAVPPRKEPGLRARRCSRASWSGSRDRLPRHRPQGRRRSCAWPKATWRAPPSTATTRRRRRCCSPRPGPSTSTWSISTARSRAGRRTARRWKPFSQAFPG